MRKYFLLILSGLLIISSNTYSNMFIGLSGGYGTISELSIASEDITLSATSINNIVQPGSPRNLEFAIDGYSLNHKIDSRHIPFALLIGYKNKMLRYGLEIGLRMHKTSSSLSGTGNLRQVTPITAGPLVGLTLNATLPDVTVNADTEKYKLLTILAKVFYDYRFTKNLTGYIGAGLGAGIIRYESKTELGPNTFPYTGTKPNFSWSRNATIQMQTSELNIEDTIFAGQFIVGTSMAINKKASVFIEYQLTQTSKIKNPVNKTYTGHSGMLGLTFNIV